MHMPLGLSSLFRSSLLFLSFPLSSFRSRLASFEVSRFTLHSRFSSSRHPIIFFFIERRIKSWRSCKNFFFIFFLVRLSTLACWPFSSNQINPPPHPPPSQKRIRRLLCLTCCLLLLFFLPRYPEQNGVGRTVVIIGFILPYPVWLSYCNSILQCSYNSIGLGRSSG